MKKTEYIQAKIGRLPKGYVFTYADFIEEAAQKEAIIKALNRLVAAGKIAKLAKGKYYKPETTIFGTLQPSQYQVVKDLLESDGKLTGYLTGLSIYNQLGLTTQVSNTIQIGKNEVRPALKRDWYTIQFIKQKNTITKENIPLLQILDAIRYIKKIPDTTIAAASRRFIAILKELSEQERNTLVRLALKYPPATRALIGAFLEETGNLAQTDVLKKTLNPITVYKLPALSKTLPAALNWNIK